MCIAEFETAPSVSRTFDSQRLSTVLVRDIVGEM